MSTNQNPIYAVLPDGKLRWWKHTGYQTGADTWEGGNDLGSGWHEALHVFSTGDGIIYALMPSGKLRWWKHTGYQTGANTWEGGNDLGSGWNEALHLFSTGNGIIYAVLPDGKLRWWKHTGYQTGANTWEGGIDFGSGWHEALHVFSTGDGIIYALMPSGKLRWWKHTGYQTGADTWEGSIDLGSGWDMARRVFASSNTPLTLLAESIDYESIDLNDPVLHDLGMRVFNTLRLSADKAVAHLAQPAAFPLPTAPDAAERRFHTLLRTLSAEQQQRAVANVMPQVNASEETRRASFGDLAQVDLRTPTAITTQVAAIPLRLTVTLPALRSQQPDLPGSAELHPANGAAPGEEVGLRTERAPLPVADAPPERLSFRIHSVTCVDETDPEVGGADDMFLAGVALTGIDRTLDTQPIGAMDLGSFNDGHVVTFSPPHQFATFDLRGSQWPRFYSVMMILIEKDHGDLSADLAALYERAKEEAKKAVEAAVTTGLAPYIGPLAPVAGKIAAWVVNELLNYLRSAWQDDFFDPLTSVITVPSATARFPHGAFASPRLSQGITGHMGEYHIEYSWERSAPLNQWTAWHPFLNTSLLGRPAVYSRDPYVMDVFVRGTDNRLWQQHWNRGQWFDWARYDGLELSSSPVADSRDPEHIHVFARGNDGQLWFKEWRPAHGMTAWKSLGGQILGEPGVRSRNPHITDVFVRGTDNRLWHKLWYFDHWEDWVLHGDAVDLTSSPAVNSMGPEHLQVFACGPHGQIWFKQWGGAGQIETLY